MKRILKNFQYIPIWSFSKYATFSEKLTFLTPLIPICTCAYQGVRNVNILENFAFVLNE